MGKKEKRLDRPPRTKIVGVRFDPVEYNYLSFLAENMGMTISDVIRHYTLSKMHEIISNKNISYKSLLAMVKSVRQRNN